MTAPPEAQAVGAFADRLDGLRRRLEGTPHDLPGDLSPIRRSLDETQGEAEALGRPELVDALRRLGLMTEVWECLAADGPDAAREAAGFCAEASGDWPPRSVTARREARRHGSSASRRDAGATTSTCSNRPNRRRPLAPLDDPGLDESPPAFDPALLLQMLTGKPPEESSSLTLSRGERVPGGRVRGPGAEIGTALAEERTGQTPDEEPAGVTEAILPGAIAASNPEPLTRPPVRLSPRERGNHGQQNGAASPPTALIELDPEIREVFLADASDLFERIEALVLTLGAGHDQAGTLHELDRCYHTLKGAAGSVGLVDLAAQIHSLEDRLTEASGVATPGLIDLLHESLGYFEGVLISLGQGKAVDHPSVTMWDQVRPRPTRLGHTPSPPPGDEPEASRLPPASATAAAPQATDG
jgi:HPt (histidine-containing phosphotransfer) domain-containing protein